MAIKKPAAVDITQDPGLTKSTTAPATPANTQYVAPPGTAVKAVTVNYVDPPLYGQPQLTITNDPGGISGQIQFNNGNSSFGGDGNLLWDNANKILRVKGLQVSNVTVGILTGIINIAPSQLKLSGGLDGQVLSTDGNGTLSWVDQTGGNGSNYSNSNVASYLPTYNGNLSGGNLIVANGVYTYDISSTGTAFLTTLNVNAVSQLGNVGNVKITGGANGQILSTNGNGNLSWINQTSGNGNPFNQDLNTTDSPTFANLTITEAINSQLINYGQPSLLTPQIDGSGDLVRLYDFGNEGNQYNYAIGVEPNNIWFNTDTNTGQTGVKFYGNGVLAARIGGEGNLFVANRVTFPDGTFQTTAFNNEVVLISDTAPNVDNGSIWFNSQEGRTFIKYNDQWIDASPTIIDPTPLRPDQDNNVEFPNDAIFLDGRIYQDAANGTTSMRWINMEPGQNLEMLRAYRDAYGEGNDERGQLGLVYQNPNVSGIYITSFNQDIQKTWTFEGTGNIKFPDDSTQNTAWTGTVSVGSVTGLGNIATVNLDGNSGNVLRGDGTWGSGGSANTGNVTFDNITIQGINGLHLSAGSDFTANLAYLQVRAGDTPSHIHFDTGNNQIYDLIIGDDQKYTQVSSTGNIILQSYDSGNGVPYTWTFGNDGMIHLQGSNSVITSSGNAVGIYTESGANNGIEVYTNLSTSIINQADINITSNFGNGDKNWNFKSTGNLRFPDSTEQQTAWTGTVSTANVTGLGNIATVNLTGSSSNVLYGNGVFAPAAGGSSYGDSNVVSLLGSFGSNTISTTGNTTVGNLNTQGTSNSANINMTSGYIGTSSGVALNLVPLGVAGTRVWSKLVPNANLAFSLGSTTEYWANGYIGNIVSTTVSATGNITGGNILSSGLISATGNGTFGNVSATLFAGNLSGTGNSNVGNLGATGVFATTLSATGTTTSGNLSTSGTLNVTGNATFGIALTIDSANNGITTTNGAAIQVGQRVNFNSGNGIYITGNTNAQSNLIVSGYATVSGNITSSGTANIVGNSTTGANAIIAGVTNTILGNTVSSFSANVNNYTQVTLQNKSTGADATADYVLTSDNGNDSTNYGDFGIINSGYDNGTPTNSLGNIVFAADTYLYAQGNTSNTSQSGGNLVIGTTVPSKTIKLFAGGNTNSALIANISNTGVAVTGALSVTGNITGSTANVTLVAGSYSTVLDNTGIATFPGAVKVTNLPAFRVYGTLSNNIVAGNTIKSTNGTTVDYNQGTYYDNTTGLFTAPVAGLYHCYGTIRIGNNNGLNQVSIQKNSSQSGANVIAFWETDTNTGTAVHFPLTGYAKCNVGDTIRLQVISGNVQFDSNDSWGVTFIG